MTIIHNKNIEWFFLSHFIFTFFRILGPPLPTNEGGLGPWRACWSLWARQHFCYHVLKVSFKICYCYKMWKHNMLRSDGMNFLKMLTHSNFWCYYHINLCIESFTSKVVNIVFLTNNVFPLKKMNMIVEIKPSWSWSWTNW